MDNRGDFQRQHQREEARIAAERRRDAEQRQHVPPARLIPIGIPDAVPRAAMPIAQVIHHDDISSSDSDDMPDAVPRPPQLREPLDNELSDDSDDMPNAIPLPVGAFHTRQQRYTHRYLRKYVMRTAMNITNGTAGADPTSTSLRPDNLILHTLQNTPNHLAQMDYMRSWLNMWAPERGPTPPMPEDAISDDSD